MTDGHLRANPVPSITVLLLPWPPQAVHYGVIMTSLQRNVYKQLKEYGRKNIARFLTLSNSGILPEG